MAQAICDKLTSGGSFVIQERILCGKETIGFCQIFTNKLVVHMGLPPSSTTDTVSAAENVRLYQVRSDLAGSHHYAFQVVASVQAFHSASPFIVISGNKAIMWRGKNCSPEALSACPSLAKRIMMIEEPLHLEQEIQGEESTQFLQLLGHTSDVFSVPSRSLSHPTRLFCCAALQITELYAFLQNDLVIQNLYILDYFDSVLIWVGPRSPPTELRWVILAAKDYVRLQSEKGDHRSANAPILVVYAKSEPAEFTTCFPDWRPVAGHSPVVPVDADAVLAKYSATYSYDDLLTDKIPGLDRTRLEEYLSDADFEQHFGMPRDQWKAMQDWKRVEIKKQMHFL